MMMPTDQIPSELDNLRVKLSTLKPYKDNPRQGDIGAVVTSLEANGQYRPIVVNKRKGTKLGGGTILAGNHTFAAAKQLGWDQIAATFVDVDDKTAMRIVLIDNRASDLASYDDAGLAGLLKQIAETDGVEALTGTGFDGDDLDGLLKDLEIPEFVPTYEDHLSDRSRDGKAEVTCPECDHTFQP